MHTKKKLIEVALPLEAINEASVREKSIRHGHPSTLHLWWARRPLAACRAVLFASLVDDPSSHPEQFPTKESQDRERQRLFHIIEKLVMWKNTNNEEILSEAREEIMKSTNGNPPPVYDPFCGGGSIPLEAQRLSLEAYASDLNPVAVLITKALIEIPPKFAGRPPVNPKTQKTFGSKSNWKGAAGLAEDVRCYGEWVRKEAEKQIGYLYPKAKLPQEYGGGEATVIAWLWTRTVKCPNPACGCQMPLVRSFWLSTKKGKEVWVEPVVDREKKTLRFEVKKGEGSVPEGTVNRRGATCICCKTPVPFEHIRNEGRAGRMGSQLMAIVAEGKNGRIYLPPNEEHTRIANEAKPTWKPVFELQGKAAVSVPLYGMKTFADLFTKRQLVALTTFSDLIKEIHSLIMKDALKVGMKDDGVGIEEGGVGAKAYADAMVTYMGLSLDRLADYSSSISSWSSTRETIRNTFSRQAIPMVWDYAESNPLSNSTGNWLGAIKWIESVIKNSPSFPKGYIEQKNAIEKVLFNDSFMPIISTDPPYYDNIGYADLSDFFYVWLRRTLFNIHPNLFFTITVPKSEELVATPYRFKGDKEKAKTFFENSLFKVFCNLKNISSHITPLTVYYAFKQSVTEEEFYDNGDILKNRASTGWETMLNALLNAGFSVNGTWPMRSELGNRPTAQGTNALTSSIVLVCRPRPDNAPLITRKDFLKALHQELPLAIRNLLQGNIAPVDLAQSAIGPGMAVYSRYSAVLEADGNPMTVRTALQIINQELDMFFAEQEGEMDVETRFCIAWYEQYGFKEAPFGEADVLARAKNTATDRLENTGILSASRGKVRLLNRDELDSKWDPSKNDQNSVWMITQQLVRSLLKDGEERAARILINLNNEEIEAAKAFVYRLYSIAERKGWTDEGVAYNSLIMSWPAIQEKMIQLINKQGEVQKSLF
jgi:putative DNA methylase